MRARFSGFIGNFPRVHVTRLDMLAPGDGFAPSASEGFIQGL